VVAHHAVDFRVPNILWRGFESLGESLGNVTFETLWAVSELGLSHHVRFAPMRCGVAWFPEESCEPRAALLSRLRGQCPEPLQVEVQAPSLLPRTLSPCVRFFFHEFGYLPQGAGPLEEGDVVWAPSAVVAETLAAELPHHPVIWAPHGVNPEVFNPQVEPTPGLDDPRFKFLYVGTTISRKGIDILLDAYLAEFAPSEPAYLVIKAFPTTAGFIWEELRSLAPRLILFEDILYPAQMAQLMRGCQVLVAPYRAEGFCLPVLEAMACSLPAIVPSGGATDDFCPEECGWRIDTHEVRSPQGPLRFLEPDVGSLRRLMRRAYEDRAEVARKGRAAAEFAKGFTWKRVTLHLLRQLAGLVGG
jgi:glycosyltransferase involved in cell wall biosynthesis